MVPPHVIGGDYVNGKVSLFLNQRVSDNWVRIFHHLGEFTNLLSTTKFSFDGKQVSIVASEEYAQRYIDQFKEWLKKANHEYEQNTPPREAGSRRKKANAASVGERNRRTTIKAFEKSRILKTAKKPHPRYFLMPTKRVVPAR